MESIVFFLDGKDVYTVVHLGVVVMYFKWDLVIGDLIQVVPIVEEFFFGVEMLTIVSDDWYVYVGNLVMSNIIVFECNESMGVLIFI